MNEVNIKLLVEGIKALKTLNDLSKSFEKEKVNEKDITNYYRPLYVEIYNLKKWLDSGNIQSFNFNVEEIMSPVGKDSVLPKELRNNAAKWRILELTVSCDKSNYRTLTSTCVGLIRGIAKEKGINIPEEVFQSKEAIKAIDTIIINLLKDTDRNYLDMKNTINEFCRESIGSEILMNNSKELTLFELNRLREDLSNEISSEIDKVKSNKEALLSLLTNLLKKKKNETSPVKEQLMFVDNQLQEYIKLRRELKSTVHKLEEDLYNFIRNYEGTKE
ncbi:MULTISPECIES: hypothetical protein [Bacillus cereus group]|uniref:hypothetical protein n=1 Tax=Bacillus cereus group TaxID=86661 RepID=UPI001F55BF4E|nr:MULTISPECIES: hypothetical protein [Bacillus cereus group]MDW3038310.1 hypothetical protein [Bacillus pacificus]